MSNHPVLTGNKGPLDWAELLFSAQFDLASWPEIGPLPHVGKVRCPPQVAALPRDTRGYPVLASLMQEEGRKGQPLKVDFKAISAPRVLVLATERRCGICGTSLATGHGDGIKPARGYFIGGPISCERSYNFNDPPMHFCCTVFALRVCPWMILARYSRTDKPEYFHHESQLDVRPIKLGLIRATNWILDAESMTFEALYPHILGYVAPQGWPTDEAMHDYWKAASKNWAAPVVSYELTAYRAGMRRAGYVPDVGALITTGREVFRPRIYNNQTRTGE